MHLKKKNSRLFFVFYRIFPPSCFALISIIFTAYVKISKDPNSLEISGRNAMKNYLSDPQKFTHPCPGRFEFFIGNTLYWLYNKNTVDFMNSFINEMSVNTDPETVEQLVFASNCFFGKRVNGKCPNYTKYITDHVKIWKKELPAITEEYSGIEGISMEVFHFVHGLRYTHKKIREYVMGKDIIDAGAFLGESAIKLSEYTNKTVYSYELSAKLTKTIKKAINKRGLENRVVVINKGISDTPGKTMINDGGTIDGSLSYKGSTEVQVTSIDNEVETLNIKPGFIKADVEGFGLNAVHGADKTITKYRPVLEIACYHAYDELYKVPMFLRKYPNYIFTYHPSNDNYESMAEISFFAYPAEILYPVFLGESID